MDPCPLAIIAFTKQRLSELKILHNPDVDTRPWYMRYLVGGKKLSTLTPASASLRWFSGYNPDTLYCEGQVKRCWAFFEDQLIPFRPDLKPGNNPPAGFENAIVDFDMSLILNFAFDSKQRICVINEIDVEGNLTRVSFELPNGLLSESFGVCLGEPFNEKIKRTQFDSCLPPGWEPTENRAL